MSEYRYFPGMPYQIGKCFFLLYRILLLGSLSKMPTAPFAPILAIIHEYLPVSLLLNAFYVNFFFFFFIYFIAFYS